MTASSVTFAAAGSSAGYGGLESGLPPGPAIAGVWPPGPGLPHPAREVWPSARLWSWGPWHGGELRTAACPGARLLTVGQCLADSGRMHQDLGRSVREGDWERLTRWPGSYLLMVLEDTGRLTALTDLAGQFPLYYTRHGDRTVLSTLATAVAAMTGRTEAFDPTALAAYLVCPAVPELAGSRTAFADVCRLGPGEALRVGPGTEALARWTYASLEPDGDACFEESADRLRESLVRATALRVRNAPRITSDFSGGMDSTSLAFLAADEAASPLDAFVYHHPKAPAGDLEHAQRFAAGTSAIRLHVTLGEDASLPYADLDARAGADQPDPAAAVAARLRLRLTDIARRGGGVHLTGEGGDALLGAPPAHLGDVPGTGGPRRLAHDALALGRLRRVSPAKVAHRALRLARTPMDRALSDLAVRLERPLPHPPQWLDAIAWWPPPGVEATWLTSRARRDLAELAAERAAQARRNGLGPSPGARAVLCELRDSAAVQTRLVEAARPFGVWTQAPFLDDEVVRAGLSLPVPHKADPYTVKPLLRAALSGAVPAALLDRRTKGDYASEDYLGLRTAVADLRVRLSQSGLADLGIVEPARVAAALDGLELGLTGPFPALNRLLGVDTWLKRRRRGEGAA
ncbi:asparagine synthase (glutamine-hydrolysing) [Streptomyces sp. 1222.5]|uniref:albusnodin/ikarugamycin family macrolactam cyclase n=1 Tax=unclassified Streptomyces TaxID=2593676 RepID=UPI0008961395|nr:MULTISPECIES: albusnodin/ikarugamycin family macrolactam cyclase [unclassified Streptomyces]PKW11405.1 asparagine synthase (glutamine-hydrolysing) [Streptomyces sp. 5112.2]SEB79920.1 asparagine synthase (glutamine-hydrolysing) [Streptomyces sp. 1222.5]